MINTLEEIASAADLVANSIPQIPEQKNFWMIRSTDGAFYSEYIREGFIGIGWNVLTEDVLSQCRERSYYETLLNNCQYKDKISGAVLAKCSKFIDEIQCGDIAVIVGKTEIAFAQIGKYFELQTKDTTPERELEIRKQIEAQEVAIRG